MISRSFLPKLCSEYLPATTAPGKSVGAGGDLVAVDGRWPFANGVSSSGAVLVCPDGLVGWRAEERVEHPEQTLEAVLADLA
jgi:putative polyketide hydroxylase